MILRKLFKLQEAERAFVAEAAGQAKSKTTPPPADPGRG